MPACSKILRYLFLFVVFCGQPFAYAQDFIETSGPLTDRDFYRAVSCKASPGKNCPLRALKWPPVKQGRVSVSLAGVQGSGPHFVSRVRNALEHAIAEINRADTGVKLRYFYGPQSRLANIRVYVVQPVGPRKTIANISYPPLNGKVADPAVTVISTLGANILSAGVALELNPALSSRLRPILLQELLEALGLAWSLKNPYYDDKSLFSISTRPSLDRIRGQDMLALMLHYPN